MSGAPTIRTGGPSAIDVGRASPNRHVMFRFENTSLQKVDRDGDLAAPLISELCQRLCTRVRSRRFGRPSMRFGSPSSGYMGCVLFLLLQLLVVGLIAGAIARLLVPGRDPMGCLGTVLLGVVGSFVGGLLAWLLFDRDSDGGAFQAAGLFGSIVGAVIALLIWRRVGDRSSR